MTEDMVTCPKDTKIMYQRDVCENIFRKGHLRVWCKNCEAFRQNEPDVNEG